jgi:Mg-chelatase subunit ChlD
MYLWPPSSMRTLLMIHTIATHCKTARAQFTLKEVQKGRVSRSPALPQKETYGIQIVARMREASPRKMPKRSAESLGYTAGYVFEKGQNRRFRRLKLEAVCHSPEES